MVIVAVRIPIKRIHIYKVYSLLRYHNLIKGELEHNLLVRHIVPFTQHCSVLLTCFMLRIALISYCASHSLRAAHRTRFVLRIVLASHCASHSFRAAHRTRFVLRIALVSYCASYSLLTAPRTRFVHHRSSSHSCIIIMARTLALSQWPALVHYRSNLRLCIIVATCACVLS